MFFLPTLLSFSVDLASVCPQVLVGKMKEAAFLSWGDQRWEPLVLIKAELGASFWTQSFFVVGTCPVHCRMVNSITGLCSLDISSTPCCDNQKECLQTLLIVPLGTKLPPVENHCIKGRRKKMPVSSTHGLNFIDINLRWLILFPY